MLNNLERKIGKYAIPNLMNYLVGGYAIGYLLLMIQSVTGWQFLNLMTLEPYYIIHGIQLWRLITWVLIPPSMSIWFVIAVALCYWPLGRTLEQTWGTFRFNLYVFGGIIFTIIGAFVEYAILAGLGIDRPGLGSGISTYYINLTLFLAFAVCFPNMQMLLYFIIPVRMKWLAILYAVFVAFDFFQSGWTNKILILSSVLNFLIFYFATRDYKSISPGEMRRKAAWKNATKGFADFSGSSDRTGGGGAQGSWTRSAASHGSEKAYSQASGGSGVISRHKCAICGRTELTNPELEFRFCSKCNGNYEYCNDHLFTHTHVE